MGEIEISRVETNLWKDGSAGRIIRVVDDRVPIQRKIIIERKDGEYAIWVNQGGSVVNVDKLSKEIFEKIIERMEDLSSE